MINCKKITVQQYGLLWLLLLEMLLFVLKAKILSFGVSNGNIYHKVGYCDANFFRKKILFFNTQRIEFENFFIHCYTSPFYLFQFMIFISVSYIYSSLL